MKKMGRYFTHALLAGGMLAVGGQTFLAKAQDAATEPAKPDNTKVNKRDRSKTAVTSDQQKENRPDRVTTQQIRKALIADKSLSLYAHNVKIVTVNGAVILKGPVRSEDEKQTVVSKAAEVAGAARITDNLSVAPAKTKKKAS